MDDRLLAQLVDEVRRFVKRLPVADMIRDDIISNTLLLISEKTLTIEAMGFDQALR